MKTEIKKEPVSLEGLDTKLNSLMVTMGNLFKFARGDVNLGGDLTFPPVFTSKPLVKKNFADIKKGFAIEPVIEEEVKKPSVDEEVLVKDDDLLTPEAKIIIDKIRDNLGRIECNGKLFKLPIALIIGGKLMLPPIAPIKTETGYCWDTVLYPLTIEGNIVTTGTEGVTFTATTKDEILVDAIDVHNKTASLEDTVAGFIDDFLPTTA